MNDKQHNSYLTAMGITRWRARDAETAEQPLPPAVAAPSTHASSTNETPVVANVQSPAPVPQTVNASSAVDFDALRTEVAGCRACGLCELRTNTVFESGTRQARLMIVGEAPGEQEDLQGEPFVGRAGRLLDAILTAFSLDRNTHAYIANVIKCRPPGNRNPSIEEIHRCAPYLQRQIDMLQPAVIVTIGRIAAQHLLQTDAPVGRLRERVHKLPGKNIPLIVSYHPAYLLRKPSEKAKAMRDWLLISAQLRQHTVDNTNASD